MHYNIKYKDFNEALGKKDGVVVLASLHTEDKSSPSDVFSRLISESANKKGKDTTLNRDSINLKYFLPKNLKEFFTYSGSLTTSPCTESVKWIIFNTPAAVNPKHLQGYRQITECNYRRAQQSHKRLVEASFQPKKDKNSNVYSSYYHKETDRNMFGVCEIDGKIPLAF